MKNTHIKNTISRYAKIGLMGLVLIGSQSCEDLLKEEVISNVGNNYLNTPAGLNDGLNAAYTSLRSWYGTERGNNMTIFGTDTYTNGADGAFKFMNFYTSDFDTQNSHVRELWDQFYAGINTCNAVIDRAPLVEGISEEVRNHRVAEAKFIRAHHYFILTQLFGGVDLQLSESLTPTNQVSRVTVPEMYEAITRDLEEAIPHLVAASKAPDYGRVTRPAAENLLGKVYITKATSEAAANDDYAKAEPLLKSVINNYDFRLLDEFSEVYAFGNEVNDEVIFAVQNTYNPLTNGTGNHSHL